MVEQVSGASPAAVRAARTVSGRRAAGNDFRKALEEAARRGKVRLSAHAAERLARRNITLSAGDIDRVSRAADRLASKGGREALVLMDSVGFILDVTNRTVVTAIERQGLKENVFTNIDSAAFA